MKCPVSSMRNGQWGTLTEINDGEDLNEKLASLGIRVGTRIGKKYGLMGRGPVVLTVGTGEVAIGYGMASRMMVEIEGGESCTFGHAHKRHFHGRRLCFWERGRRRQKSKS